MILEDGEDAARIIEHVAELIGDGIRIDGHGNSAEGLRGKEGPIELRPIAANDRDRISALDADCRQACRISAHIRRKLGPGPALPEPEILVAHGDFSSARARVMQHEPRKCVELFAQVGGQVASLRHEDEDALTGAGTLPILLASANHSSGWTRPRTERAARALCTRAFQLDVTDAGFLRLGSLTRLPSEEFVSDPR